MISADLKDTAVQSNLAGAVNDIGCDPSRQRSVVLIIVVVIIIVAPVSSSSDASIVAIVGFCLINRHHDA